MLYLQTDHIRDRPPRINKISGILDKLRRFAAKLEDLERRLRVRQTFVVTALLVR